MKTLVAVLLSQVVSLPQPTPGQLWQGVPGIRPRVSRTDGRADRFGADAPRTNMILWSEAIDNVAWTASTTGSSVPTITAGAAAGPDGTTGVAERVQIGGCPSASSFSAVFQNYTGTAVAWTSSIYVFGNGASGTIGLWLFDSTAVAGNLTTCAYTNGVWTRCSVTRTFANATHRFGFGCNNDATLTGATDTGAADVFVSWAQSELGSSPTSYIPTTSAPVTR